MRGKLKKLGLTSYESNIYRTLVEYGRLDAKKISEYSKVPPTAVYPNLTSLENKQLIQKFKGDISTFEVLEPSVAIPAFIRNKTMCLDEIKISLVEEVENRLHQKEIIPTKEVVQVTTGKEASAAIYENFVKKAERTIYILGWSFHTIGDKYNRLRCYQKAINRGVEIRIITIGKRDKQWELIEAYKKAGIKMRYVPLENFSIVIVDGQECKITLKGKENPNRFNIHVNDKSLAKALESYFLTTWDNSEEI